MPRRRRRRLRRAGRAGRVGGRFDSRYIVAARHPHRFEDTGLDKSRTQYFYVIRAADGPAADLWKAVIGPFDRVAFAREAARRRLPGFTIRVAGLE